jgi:hypothetical protein
MRRYFSNTLIRIGLGLVVVGWLPLWGIVFLASIGLWPDPDPNPMGPGMLFYLTAIPAIVCLALGAVQVRRQPRPPGSSSLLETLSAQPIFKVIALLGGAGLIFYGILTLRTDTGRGPASSIVVGAVICYWAVGGKTPVSFRS